ncbi:Na+/H+ antiporter NhaC family protein [Salmonella enterica]|uniref:Na+/H+ antiporter NhaC family protein n=1 Tax=Salmonella enterica TaxID=28901 RepID=UPI003D2FE0AC
MDLFVILYRIQSWRVLDKVGYLNAVLSRATARAQGCRKLSLITYVTGWLGCAVTSEVYVAQMLNGRIYKDVYEREGIDNAMLSRYIEESTTVFDMFYPGLQGAFMATVLGVANLHYLPFSFFCLLTPVVSMVLTIFGIGIIKHGVFDGYRIVRYFCTYI